MNIDETIKQAQREAIDIHYSVWLAASAGSGKTTVLTNRVLNLLLCEIDPFKILCLTFTKAAAAEMSNRITNILKIWTSASLDKLIEMLTQLRGFPPDDNTIIKARHLFTDVLETPGGMKIMTIHAFCQSVLKRFPIEAHISPQFEVIDDAQSEILIKKAFDLLITDKLVEEDLNFINGYFHLNQPNMNIFKVIQSNIVSLKHLTDTYPKLETIEKKLKEQYGLSHYSSENEIISDYFQSNDAPIGEITTEAFLNLKSLYLSKTTGRTNGRIKKELKEKAVLYDEAYQKYHLLQAIKLTVRFLNFAKHFIQTYESLKKEEGVLDYDDLIAKTRELLQSSSQWVMYKLDGGIDHILVDEAQDTNAEQWNIIRLISEEFFAGLGRETDMERTLFVVGDKKQSIYSFQGADPLKFDEMKRYFRDKITNSRHTFKIIPMNASFRSTSAVLNLVNDLLNRPAAARGVIDVGENATHNLTRINEPGLIEIHPPVKVYSSTSYDSWPILERNTLSNAVMKVSADIADKIKEFLDTQEMLDSQNRPIEPKDITILLRNRGTIDTELVRALKDRGIPVAGIDRLDLSAHIAVQDLMATAKFALLPEDDLNLACVLKSPLIGLSEEELADLCIYRNGQTLWKQIQLKNDQLTKKLLDILNLADKMPPYEFFATILGAYEGRKQFLARLGFEAMEAIDEFLNMTLTFEQTNISSLQNFVYWFQARKSVIKRDMEQNDQNTVKIMTVHASKGLQNNIIFIVDNQDPRSKKSPLLWQDELPIWLPEKEFRSSDSIEKLYEREAQKQEEEEHRLLYVAITRARDRVYIYGWHKMQKEKDDKKEAENKENTAPLKEKTWHQLISAAVQEKTADENGVIRICQPADYQPHFMRENREQNQTPEKLLPAWVKTPAPVETPLSKPLMPSRLIDNEPISDSIVGTGQEKALKRGTFLHKLLQYLPQIPPEKRKETALKLKPADIELPARFFEIFENNFKPLFGSNSMAEVPIVGIVGGKVFSGQIDRLIINEKEVWIVDFKTNRTVPSAPEEVHRIYKMQLAAYKNLIKKIFSDKIIKTFLLWTENMSLMEMTNETASFDEQFEKDEQ